ncbi:DUF2971 domain-containing protein [Teredinibacter turnerae]|uniref:DUF2971 domain-containing protein n=1 Tax=Teredinibacter turnerae TaxID=2426 RepID=UPI0030CBEF14
MPIRYESTEGESGAIVWDKPQEIYRFLGSEHKSPKKYLYKYAAITPYLLDSLSNNYLWFSSPSQLNDPFDSKLYIDYKLDPDEIEKSQLAYTEFDKDLKNTYRFFKNFAGEKYAVENFALHRRDLKISREHSLNLLHNIIQMSLKSEVDKMIGVCSLTEDPSSILMWSHYGRNHEGVCLKFKHRSSPMLSTNCFPVRYRKFVKKFMGEPKCPEDYFSVYFKCVYSKYIDWSYEKEWRLFNHEGAGAGLIDKSDLVGIIFGLNTKQEEISKVVHVVKDGGYPNISFYKAFHDPFRYKIYIIPVELDFAK